MVGPGMSGNFAQARNWFIAAIGTTLVGCGAYLHATYYKSRSKNTYTESAMDAMNIAAKDISKKNSGVKPTKARR